MHIKIIYTKPGLAGLTKAEMWSCYVPYFKREDFTIRQAVQAWEKFSGNIALCWAAF